MGRQDTGGGGHQVEEGGHEAQGGQAGDVFTQGCDYFREPDLFSYKCAF